jgi:hypothetical protein
MLTACAADAEVEEIGGGSVGKGDVFCDVDAIEFWPTEEASPPIYFGHPFSIVHWLQVPVEPQAGRGTGVHTPDVYILPEPNSAFSLSVEADEIWDVFSTHQFVLDYRLSGEGRPYGDGPWTRLVADTYDQRPVESFGEIQLSLSSGKVKYQSAHSKPGACFELAHIEHELKLPVSLANQKLVFRVRVFPKGAGQLDPWYRFELTSVGLSYQ